ncbi:MAG: hypothetical protein J7L63_04265 [Thermoplasmata archaeon]|nr:hypothetical protein [Thermoplasmata archaeon]
MKRKTKALLLVSLLSPFIAEVISGSTTPEELLKPFSFPFLWVFYGSGVILMRELWIRFGKNHTSLMLLSISYGMIEEGVAVKSFFDPHWEDLGLLAHYGRFMG